MLDSELKNIADIDMAQFGFDMSAFEDPGTVFKDQNEVDVDKDGKQEKECECPACGFRFIP